MGTLLGNRSASHSQEWDSTHAKYINNLLVRLQTSVKRWLQRLRRTCSFQGMSVGGASKTDKKLVKTKD